MESPRHADMGQLTMLDFHVHSSAPFSTLGNLTWEGPVSVPWRSNTHLNPAVNTTSNGSMERQM